MAINSTSPATGEEVARYEQMTRQQIRETLAATRDAFVDWRGTDFDHRGGLMHAAAARLRAGRDEYARLMALEMGKPVREGRSEIDKCAWVCEFYADNASRFLQPVDIETDATRSFVTFNPLGVILAVMPWNFPFWQVLRFAAPALMAGNGGVLKHASNVTGCALAIEEVFRDAGFPDDLFRTLVIPSADVAAVIEHPAVAAVTLTGSDAAGRAVAAKAGAMLKKTVLELGGSDPYVLLSDADVETAAETCVTSRLINGGQSCIAAKRFIVPEPLLERFERRFVELMSAKRMGDPLDEDSDIGPQAREDLRDDLHRQVTDSVERGARLLLGGEVPDRPGAFYPPTVLTAVAPGMPAYDEELFGPVAAIIPVRDDEQAIRVANDSVFGLGAAVFTRDTGRGQRIAADDIEAGCCFVNAMVRSDPRLPFGGIKLSGYGRELGDYGIKEFVNIKTVYVQ